jgi:hypothetical protein
MRNESHRKTEPEMSEKLSPDKMLYIDTPNGRVMVTVEDDGSRWVSVEDYKKLMDIPVTNKPFLELIYSFAKQYISFYERQIKRK